MANEFNPSLNYYPAAEVAYSSTKESTPENPTANTPVSAANQSNIVPTGGGTVMNGGTLQSPNYSKGNSGWIIDSSGNVEFDNGNFRGDITGSSGTFSGTITASSGTIGGWNITATNLRSGASDAASNVLIDSANSLLRLGPTTGNYITLDGSNLRIRSSNYSAGVSGFTIEPTLIEAENLVARGSLRGVSFKYDVISAVGGQLLISNSDVLASDMTALDASTMTVRGDTTFAVNDILLIRSVSSGIQEEYFRVTNIGSAPTYTVTRDLASAYSADSNPTWKAGTTVVKFGKSDGSSAYSGGWLRLLGEGTNSPYYSVFSRTGLAYNSYSERVRLGNLNGIGAFVADTYGIFIGNYSTGKYLTYDDASGNLNVNGYVQSNIGAFGGDGSDGALSVSSGTTTIDASSANLVVKNYTSITISSGATLTISNKASNGTILYLKCSGDVTIAGTIEMSSMGADSATTGFAIVDDSSHFGGTGTNGSGAPAAGGSGGVIYTNKAFYTTPNTSTLYRKFIILSCGSGGGPGGRGGNSGGLGGAGGVGGGVVIIECRGALNFSGTINVNGGAGVTGSNGASSTQQGGGGGGGGGGAGMALILYNTLTANSGTINAKGGAGGNGGTGGQGGGGFSGGGGGGGSGNYTRAGKTGGTGNNAAAGSPGVAATDSDGASGGAGGSSGGGGSELGGTGGAQGSSDTNNYLVTQNKYFA